MSVNTYVDQDTCASCGGRCCKRHAGALFPSDIKGSMYKGLVELLSTGMYQIDWYDRNPMMSFEELRSYTMTLQTGELKRVESRAPRAKAYYIRPAHVDARNLVRPLGGEDRNMHILGWRERMHQTFEACPMQGVEVESRRRLSS